MLKPIPILFAQLLTLLLFSGAMQAAGEPGYIGSERCASCHQAAYENWQQSHHKQAMQPATSEFVVGDFDNSSFEHFGVRSEFSMVDGKYTVRTDNADGEMELFTIAYTFGFYPLQQYLIAFDDGRYQTLSVAWDSRPEAEGGQRWFHMYPDEAIPHDDPLHWTGAFQNWNSRCASCHSTDLRKNYSQETDSYQTEWSEVTVGCEACHGPGSEHLAWAEGDRSSADKGLVESLADGGHWQATENSATMKNSNDARPQRQLSACGGCHSRRQEIAHAEIGVDFLDKFSPTLLREGLYFPDGQIEDEVYVYGSFLQSKMHAEGVVCSNCHEPHSLKLRAEGNALCSQCHAAASFDTPEHHHHQAASDGAQCVNCHMPERTYMVVDPRRDHSFRVPQPILSGLLNTPNACTGCHQDKDNAWAKQSLQDWLGHQPLRDEHAATLAIARNNSPAAVTPLLKLAADPDAAPIVRATAIEESGRFPSTETVTKAIELLYDDEPLIRMGAVQALYMMPPDQRYTLLGPLVDDPVKAVRMNVAAALAGVQMSQLKPQQAQALTALFKEYENSMALSADMPSSQLNLAVYYSSQGKQQQALAAYQHALKLSPGYLPAMLNLADLYRSLGQEDKAKPLLLQVIELAPDQAPAYHALGLLLVRQKQVKESLPYLQKAAQLAPAVPRYIYVYGVALHSSGQPQQAIEVLTQAMQDHPYDQQIQSALKAYKEQAGG